MQHYVYAVTNLLDGKVYVGKHSTDNLDDGYMGSGKLVSRAISKHGLENFRKDILGFFDTEVEALDVERQLVTEEFVSRDDTYNLIPGGHGSFSWINKHGKHIGRRKVHSDSAKSKMGRSMRDKKHTDATKQKIREQNLRINNPERAKKISDALKGKQKTKEHCMNISKTLKAKKFRHSEKTRQKMSNNRTGKPCSEKRRLAISKAMSESWKRKKNALVAQEVEHQSATLEVVESWST